MAPLYLSAHQHVAICGDDLVILDVKAGSYSLLAGAGAGAGATLTSDRCLYLGDDDLIANLRKEGILVETSGLSIKPLPSKPERSALKGSPRRGANCAYAVTTAWAEMAVTYYGRPFEQLVQTAQREQVRAVDRDPENVDIADLAFEFDRLSPWIPFQGDCLFRCFMLLRMLNRQGHRADWVFGVRTWPFYAHCWLQVGDLVLTDYAEPLVNFTPIFVV